MATDDLANSQYPALLSDLTSLLKQGQQTAINSVNAIRLKTYWAMGQRLANAGVLADASSTISQLATDLNLEPSLLYRIRQFYQLWPTAVPTIDEAKTLSWSHFVELLSIPDEKERDFYLEEATAQDWSRDALRKAIEKDLFAASKSPKKLNPATSLTRPTDSMHV